MEIEIQFGSLAKIKVEGDSDKDAMKGVGIFGEILPKCGHCGSDALVPTCRSSGGYDYYEVKCTSCGYSLALGQRKEGGLYPKEWKPPFKGAPRQEDASNYGHQPATTDGDDEIPF